MDTKRFSHFITLAEEGRFASAAERVHLSQAAFSRSIQTLEEQVGMRLFDRGAKGATLTAAGDFFLERAKKVALDMRCLDLDLALLKSGDVGEIAVGAGPAPAAVMVPDMLCELHRQTPALIVRVVMGSLPTLLLQLDAQKLDFCLGDARLLDSTARYETALVGKVYGALYCRKGHPLVRRTKVGVDDLIRYRIARVSVSPVLMKAVSNNYGFAQLKDFPLAVECDDVSTLVYLVTHTDVIGLLPVAMAERNPKLTRLNTSNLQAPFAEVSALWLKGRTLAPSAHRAIQIAKNATNSK